MGPRYAAHEDLGGFGEVRKGFLTKEAVRAADGGGVGGGLEEVVKGFEEVEAFEDVRVYKASNFAWEVEEKTVLGLHCDLVVALWHMSEGPRHVLQVGRGGAFECATCSVV